MWIQLKFAESAVTSHSISKSSESMPKYITKKFEMPLVWGIVLCRDDGFLFDCYRSDYDVLVFYERPNYTKTLGHAVMHWLLCAIVFFVEEFASFHFLLEG